LEKCGKIKKHGKVKIHLSFGFEKNLKAALQEHRHLLYVILSHELQISKVKQNVYATAILHHKCEGTRTTGSSLLTCDPHVILKNTPDAMFWLVTSCNVERHSKCFQGTEFL